MLFDVLVACCVISMICNGILLCALCSHRWRAMDFNIELCTFPQSDVFHHLQCPYVKRDKKSSKIKKLRPCKYCRQLFLVKQLKAEWWFVGCRTSDVGRCRPGWFCFWEQWSFPLTSFRPVLPLALRKKRFASVSVLAMSIGQWFVDLFHLTWCWNIAIAFRTSMVYAQDNANGTSLAFSWA